MAERDFSAGLPSSSATRRSSSVTAFRSSGSRRKTADAFNQSRLGIADSRR